MVLNNFRKVQSLTLSNWLYFRSRKSITGGRNELRGVRSISTCLLPEHFLQRFHGGRCVFNGCNPPSMLHHIIVVNHLKLQVRGGWKGMKYIKATAPIIKGPLGGRFQVNWHCCLVVYCSDVNIAIYIQVHDIISFVKFSMRPCTRELIRSTRIYQGCTESFSRSPAV